ncbi:MAG TPA: hypothetical protein VGM44_06480 [Polyangiaceae bacterium]|jgi:hypothetical protein
MNLQQTGVLSKLLARRVSFFAFALLAPRPARAQESPTPTREVARVEATIYGGSGSEYFMFNEGHSVDQQRALGLGLLGSLRLGAEPGVSQPNGTVLLFGVTSELKALGFAPSFVNGAYSGFRAGVGYDERWVGGRGGFLIAGGSALNTETLALPDFALRVGPLDTAYLMLGLGAYDAPTSLRPGIYLGAAVVPIRGLTASIHWGLHLDHGSFGDGLQLDPRLDFTLGYQLTRAVTIASGVVDQSSPSGNHVYEAHLSTSVGFFD